MERLLNLSDRVMRENQRIRDVLREALELVRRDRDERQARRRAFSSEPILYSLSGVKDEASSLDE